MSNRAQCTDPACEVLLGPYELGLLTEEERIEFEHHLEVCAACREELYVLSSHTDALQADPRRAIVHLAPARSWKALLRWRILLPACAGAALALLLLNLGGEDDWSRLARIEVVPYAQMETRAPDLRPSDRLIREGMDAYANEEYAQAAAVLAQAVHQMDGATSAGRRVAFYAGLSFLLSSEADSAASYLALARRANLPLIADRATWALAQAHLLREDPDAAVRLLESLAHGSPGYREKAADQLAQIRAARK